MNMGSLSVPRHRHQGSGPLLGSSAAPAAWSGTSLSVPRHRHQGSGPLLGSSAAPAAWSGTSPRLVEKPTDLHTSTAIIATMSGTAPGSAVISLFQRKAQVLTRLDGVSHSTCIGKKLNGSLSAIDDNHLFLVSSVGSNKLKHSILSIYFQQIQNTMGEILALLQ
ncbi:hypothetical protein UY3_13560 [Chelonia mydas]|uniref:Uncharacterized protein n=1 Tax=Chelonia mydas TaxID=8469 RepID=M7BME9_CHEMY|nr:hypothetical protein UY3_13560 [Chelonia mydas]